MDLLELRKLVSDGKIFSVDFVKRTDGTQRRMVARTGVSAGVTGKDRAYDPAAHDLLLVYDMKKKGYRMIPADAILRFRARGVERTFGLANRGAAQYGTTAG